ncbi:MAG TPA: right-handed parallel beta-helix repeat-containing protein, partial [Bacteroidales bacterium]|nr:right-handed parallel beta-helix repeat-containing protein [Bacteroidales bacterium]
VYALQRGYEYSGQFTIDSDSVSVCSGYGTGEKPILKGSTPVTGWTNYSGNIWKATLNTRTQQVFVDGQKIQISASTSLDTINWFHVTSKTSETQFSSDEVIGKDLTDAYISLWISQWSLSTIRIISSNSSTGEMVIDRAPRYVINSSAFFISNSLEYMEAGRWCYTESDSTLYVWTPTGDSPANHIVEASTIDCAFEGTELPNDVALSNISIHNLAIKNYNKIGVNVYGVKNEGSLSENISIDNCDFTDNNVEAINLGGFEIGSSGVNYIGVTGCKITNCNISGSSGKAINIRNGWLGDNGDGNSVVSNNTISDIGLPKNIGLDGLITETHGGEAMNVGINTTTISNNTIRNIGYNGVSYFGFDNAMENNIISKTNLFLHDGGGIYSYGDIDGSVIKNNIVYDIGVDGHADYGIYMDNNTRGVTIKDNAVYGCASFGIFLHDCWNDSIIGNVVYNNEGNQFYSTNGGYLDSIYVAGNTFFGLTTSQQTAEFGISTWSDSLYQLGVNGFYNPQLLGNISSGKVFSLEGFKAFSGNTQSIGNDTLINFYVIDSLFGSNRISTGTFDTQGDVDAWNITAGQSWDINHLDTCLAVTLTGDYELIRNTLSGGDSTKIGMLSYDVITDGDYMTGKVYIGDTKVGTFVADDVRRHFVNFIPDSLNNQNGLMFIPSGTPDSTFYIDNIELYDVNATYTDPTEKCNLFVNDTKAVKSFTLNGTYTDLDGNVVTGSLSLAPFTSRILIKQDAPVTSSVNQKPTIDSQSFTIQDIRQAGDFIGQVVASDPDAGQSLT